jgi:hypothetical protein
MFTHTHTHTSIHTCFTLKVNIYVRRTGPLERQLLVICVCVCTYTYIYIRTYIHLFQLKSHLCTQGLWKGKTYMSAAFMSVRMFVCMCMTSCVKQTIVYACKQNIPACGLRVGMYLCTRMRSVCKADNCIYIYDGLPECHTYMHTFIHACTRWPRQGLMHGLRPYMHTYIHTLGGPRQGLMHSLSATHTYIHTYIGWAKARLDGLSEYRL